MGGRGSSSSRAGGGNASSSDNNVLKISTANVKNMTTSALYSERENNKLAELAVVNVMSQIASKRNNSWDEMPNEYYDAKRTLTKIQQRSLEVSLEIAERKSQETKTAAKKTFVNSFGEATSRDITSDSYKKALKRTEKAVLRNLGY